MSEQGTYIQITPEGIKYGFNAYRIQDGEMFSWYIPAFDIYFSSKNIDEGKKTGNAMVKSFFNFWIKDQGPKAFVAQITKLGFQIRKEDAAAIRKILNSEPVQDAKFKSANGKISAAFKSGEIIGQEGEIAIVI